LLNTRSAVNYTATANNSVFVFFNWYLSIEKYHWLRRY